MYGIKRVSFLVYVSILVSLLTFSGFLIRPSIAKSQYVEPLNMGMKVTVPWDIANIFNRYPIQGTLSAFLALALGAILFFGVITAPFGYMFGIPSEKYVVGDYKPTFLDSNIENSQPPPFFEALDASPRAFPDSLVNKRKSVFSQEVWDYFMKAQGEEDIQVTNLQSPGDPQDVEKCQTQNPLISQKVWDGFMNSDMDMDGDSETSRSVKKSLSDLVWKILAGVYVSDKGPKFLESMFYLMPEADDGGTEGCRLLTICYAHATLKRLPLQVLKIYGVFSQKLKEFPRPFKDAIIIGMEDEDRCSQVYSNYCLDNAFTIALKSYLHLLPFKGTFSDFPKRKQAMYL